MPASLTEEELARLEALEAAATPGPWRAGRADMTSYHGDGRGPYKAIYVDDPNGEPHHMGGRLPSVVAEALAGLEGEERCIENAQFIAAMRNALPALLASARAVRNVEAVLGDLRRAAEMFAQGGNGIARAALLGAVVSVRDALTATAEPTAGEDDHAAK